MGDMLRPMNHSFGIEPEKRWKKAVLGTVSPMFPGISTKQLWEYDGGWWGYNGIYHQPVNDISYFNE